jgi:hypothetical protein
MIPPTPRRPLMELLLRKNSTLVQQVLIIPSELFKMLCSICITNYIFKMTRDIKRVVTQGTHLHAQLQH